jgi:hypothetical protein
MVLYTGENYEINYCGINETTLGLTWAVVPRALAASSQCPRRKPSFEPSNTSRSVNRFRNCSALCLQKDRQPQGSCAVSKVEKIWLIQTI